jgi:hypothetical protein
MKLGTPEIIALFALLLIPYGLYRLGYNHGKAMGAKEALEKEIEEKRKKE